MNTASPTVLHRPSPPFPYDDDDHQTVDLSPLEFVLALIAIITIPALIYALFFSIRCPPNPFRRRRRQNSDSSSGEHTVTADGTEQMAGNWDVKFKKEEHEKDVDGDCPICLSAFVDGEEIRVVSVCKHSFHTTCIDLWLDSHSDCPVCRAIVGSERNNADTSNNGSRLVRDHHDDLQQGLPDSATLV